MFQAPYTVIGFTVSPCPCRGRVEKSFKGRGKMGFYKTPNSGDPLEAQQANVHGQRLLWTGAHGEI